jgi:hypothetical protein
MFYSVRQVALSTNIGINAMDFVSFRHNIEFIALKMDNEFFLKYFIEVCSMNKIYHKKETH